MSKKAAAMGADVLSIITPYFAAASQDELYTHYMALLKRWTCRLCFIIFPPAPATR